MELNKIYNENCLTGLKKLDDNSIDCCITSPPYYGLRDYGTDEQIGLEETPDKFIQSLVDVFNEVRRVLKPDGTLWLNLGDSYASHKDNKSVGQSLSMGSRTYKACEMQLGKSRTRDSKMLKSVGLKNKDLIGIPWMAAFALRSSGWYLRQDIIWHKPNPMPESVTDRCTKSHEYIFLMSKNSKYYYDCDSIKTKVKADWGTRNRTNGKYHNEGSGLTPHHGLEKNYETANKRSVWSVNTNSFKEAHFATFPEDLIVDMIKAGCKENGIVLDPFMGSGTTGLVAKKLNRNYIGFELNPEYIKIAENRIIKEIGLFI